METVFVVLHGKYLSFSQTNKRGVISLLFFGQKFSENDRVAVEIKTQKLNRTPAVF